MAQALVADHGGEVPQHDGRAPACCPGVGRKTANVILGNAYGINEGITVDTHVTRLSRLLGLTRHDDPVKIEQDLMPLFPRDHWALLSHLLIFHGRQICIARRPRCGECVLADLCPSAAGLTGQGLRSPIAMQDLAALDPQIYVDWRRTHPAGVTAGAPRSA